MQAIVTKYMGPTDQRGTRIKATAAAGSVVMGYKYNLNIEENHAKAAKMLADKFKWLNPNAKQSYTLHGGQIPNGDYVWVMVEGSPQ
jgi:hypothetical protein